jgi:hypothetical protein
MLGGFTRSLSALHVVHFTLHTGAGVDSVVYVYSDYNCPNPIPLQNESLPAPAAGVLSPYASVSGTPDYTPLSCRHTV